MPSSRQAVVVAAAPVPPWLERLLARKRPAIRQAFLELWRLWRAHATSERIERWIIDRQVPESELAFWREGLRDVLRGELGAVQRTAAYAGWKEAEGGLKKQEVEQPGLAGVEAWIERRRGELSQWFTEQQATGIADGVTWAARHAQYSAAELTPVIRELVGLTSRQQRSLTALYERLRAEHGSRRASELVRDRAELLRSRRAAGIARHELSSAWNQGGLEAMRELERLGQVQNVQKTWWTMGFLVCEICRPLHGKEVPLASQFSSGGRTFSAPPAHLSCRCGLAYRFAGRIER